MPNSLPCFKQGDVKTVALAPEAGSERLRRVINKNLSEADLEQAVLALHETGLSQLRLYFLLGLPTETGQDVDDIPKLCKHLQHPVTRAASGRPHLANITLSLNSFVPKPFTPFQWAPFAGVAALKDRIKRVKRELQGQPRIRVHADLPKWAYYQALLARGDRRVGSLLLAAHQAGGDWARACRQSALNPDFFVMRERGPDELFPWDFIDHGVDKTYLWEEYQNALAARETPPCQPDRLHPLRRLPPSPKQFVGLRRAVLFETNVQSNGGIGFPACAIPEVIPLKLNVHFDCDLV